MSNMLYEYYQPTDAFIAYMQRIKLNDFASDYCDEDDNDKKVRNTYDNRMRNKNLVMYYMHSLLKENSKRTISTQTDVTISEEWKELKKDGVNAIAFVMEDK